MNVNPLDALRAAFWAAVHEAEWVLSDIGEFVKSIPVSFGSWGEK